MTDQATFIKPRNDIPALLVGYDEVEAFIKPYLEEEEKLRRAYMSAIKQANETQKDMQAIRGLLAEAGEAWAGGDDHKARELVRQAATRAAGSS